MKSLLLIASGDKKKASSRVRAYSVADFCHKHFPDVRAQCVQFEEPDLPNLIKQFDIILFQKVCNKHAAQLLNYAKSLGKKTFYDIDDGLFLYFFNGAIRFDRMIKWYPFVLPMIWQSDGVIVGGHYLENFCKKLNKNVCLIPTSISLEKYSPLESAQNRHSELVPTSSRTLDIIGVSESSLPKTDRSRIEPRFRNKFGMMETEKHLTFGWIGHGGMYKNDLVSFASAFKKLQHTYDFNITLVGTLGEKDITQAYSEIKNTRLIANLNWENEDEVVKTIQQFDVGIMPLKNTLWNRYKCGYKLIQYMGCGVVPLASAVGENTYIIDEGENGFLVRDEIEWPDILEKTITMYYKQPDEFNYIRQRAYEKIKQEYSYEANVPRFIDFLEL